MALVGSAMAQAVIGNLNGQTDPGEARKSFWDSVKDYVGKNGKVTFSWVAFSPPPASTPDPMSMVTCDIDVSGDPGLGSGNYGDNPDSALSMFASECNKCVSTWKVKWPPGFTVSPSLLIPSIQFSTSGATDQQSAMTHICNQICAGIIGPKATPTVSGTHSAFVGTGTLISVI